MFLPFEKIYCLNISKTQDRRKNMEKMFKNNNIENDIIFTEYTDLDFLKNNKYTNNLCIVLYSMFNVYINNDKFENDKIINCLSCLLNHYQIIKYNYDIGTNTICVFEDDSYITDKNLFEHYLNDMPNDWDAIRFGLTHWYDFSNDPNLYNLKVNQCITGTLCYVMNRNAMKAYIDYITNDAIRFADLAWQGVSLKCNVYYTRDQVVLPNYKFKSIINNFTSY